MALNIKTVKISFSRIGITTSNTPRRVCYLPMATIKYMDAKRKQKQEFLTGTSLGDMDSCVISKKTYLGLVIGGSFFAVLCKDNMYHFFDEEGEHIASRENNRCAGSSRRGRFHRQERRHLDNVFCNRRNTQMASSYRRRERTT